MKLVSWQRIQNGGRDCFSVAPLIRLVYTTLVGWLDTTLNVATGPFGSIWLETTNVPVSVAVQSAVNVRESPGWRTLATVGRRDGGPEFDRQTI